MLLSFKDFFLSWLDHQQLSLHSLHVWFRLVIYYFSIDDLSSFYILFGVILDLFFIQEDFFSSILSCLFISVLEASTKLDLLWTPTRFTANDYIFSVLSKQYETFVMRPCVFCLNVELNRWVYLLPLIGQCFPLNLVVLCKFERGFFLCNEVSYWKTLLTHLILHLLKSQSFFAYRTSIASEPWLEDYAS